MMFNVSATKLACVLLLITTTVHGKISDSDILHANFQDVLKDHRVMDILKKYNVTPDDVVVFTRGAHKDDPLRSQLAMVIDMYNTDGEMYGDGEQHAGNGTITWDGIDSVKSFTVGNRRIYATVELDGANTSANKAASAVDRITGVYDVYDFKLFATGQVDISELSVNESAYFWKTVDAEVALATPLVILGLYVAGLATALTGGTFAYVMAGLVAHGYISSFALGMIILYIVDHPKEAKRKMHSADSEWAIIEHWVKDQMKNMKGITNPFHCVTQTTSNKQRFIANNKQQAVPKTNTIQ